MYQIETATFTSTRFQILREGFRTDLSSRIILWRKPVVIYYLIKRSKQFYKNRKINIIDPEISSFNFL